MGLSLDCVIPFSPFLFQPAFVFVQKFHRKNSGEILEGVSPSSPKWAEPLASEWAQNGVCA